MVIKGGGKGQIRSLGLTNCRHKTDKQQGSTV